MAKVKIKKKVKTKSKTKKKIKVEKSEVKTKKSIKKKKSVVIKAKMGKLIGKITHYFSNIEVAVIKLSTPLKMGDVVRIIGGQETDFEQKVKSMQIEHKEVKSAKKGDSVGMKIDEKVHEGYKVYKI